MLLLLRRVAPLLIFTLALLGAPSAVAEPLRHEPAAQSRHIYIPAIQREIFGAGTRFAVIGDYGANSLEEADVARLVKGWRPQFIVTVGDNNYPSGAAATIDQNIGKYYHAFIAPYRGSYGPGAASNRFFPTLGNHDWDTSGAKPYLDYFTLPGNERYYDVVRGTVHLFAIDSDEHEPDGITADSKQGRWLKGRLSASRSCWDLVFMHHPPYSSGLPGSSQALQWPFRAWGADAVLTGHAHVYERLVVDRLLYFVNGLGGEEIHPFGTPAAGSQMRYNADFGAMLVEATSSQITFRFYSRAGKLIDSSSLRKNCQ
jgi:tartrate-resistant acid phosphatase type 5